MKNNKTGSENRASRYLQVVILVLALLISSCGYRMVGSSLLPFESIKIKHVRNETYEPRLEDRLHSALSKEFINQGIAVNSPGAEVMLEATVINFELGAIGAIDDIIKEQELIMDADIRIHDNGKVTEFKGIQSPIKITFQTTGTVSDSVAQKETAIDKACSEIAKEIVGRIILQYAK